VNEKDAVREHISFLRKASRQENLSQTEQKDLFLIYEET
jgi:hypothetical protein